MGVREAFDPLRNYEVNRDFAWCGQQLKAGAPFNDRRDMRRFRQLYDGRFLRMSTAPSGAPNFKRMTDVQLRDWLVQAGLPTLAHPRAIRLRLIERCQRVWLEKQKGPHDGVAAGHVHPQGSSEGVQGEVASRAADAGSGRKRERLR